VRGGGRRGGRSRGGGGEVGLEQLGGGSVGLLGGARRCGGISVGRVDPVTGCRGATYN